MNISSSRSVLRTGIASDIGRRLICTTSKLEKRQSPLTVRTPRWKTAAIERKQFVTQLRKPRSLDNLKAEIQLDRNPVNLNLFTTTRIGTPPQDNATAIRTKPNVMLSKDESFFICYHPEPIYQKEKTKDAWERPKWYGEQNDIENYKEEMTDKQIAEAKLLIEEDSNLWSAPMLGHMMKVKPSVISDIFPRTREQDRNYHIERQMLTEFGKVRRMDYRKYQNKERIEYIRKTRGEDAVIEFKRVLNI
eukprot:gene6122-6826_t